jgi:DUF177 domain-containing protein
VLDLGTLRLAPGDVRRVGVTVHMEPLRFGGQTYAVEPPDVDASVELQATAGGLYMKLSFSAAVAGPCYRCLEDARADVSVRASEYQARGPEAGSDELDSDYLSDDELDVDRWARDALVLALPAKILCRPDCAGLCARCGERLEPGADHDCGPADPDPRWEALRGLLE